MDFDLNVEMPDRLSDGAWHGHVIFAQWIIQQLKPSVFVELGTHNGDSYFSFCQAVKKNNLTTKCHAVDSWQGEEHAGFYGEEVFDAVNKYNQENYSSFSTLHKCLFDEAVDSFENGSIDLLHIDGFHSYEAVSHDFNIWLPKLSANAVVLFHDTNEIKVGFGVWRFWDELAERYPKTHFNFLHSHGLGVLGIGSNYPVALNKLFDANGEEMKAYRDFFSTLTEILIEPVEKKRSTLRNQYATIYVDSGSGLSEKEKERVELNEMQGRIKFSLSNYRTIKQIRLDFGTAPVFLHLSNLVVKKADETTFIPIVSSGNYKNHIQIPSKDKDVAPEMLFLFNLEKPQLFMNFLNESYNSISFEYRIFGFHELTNYSLVRDLLLLKSGISKKAQQVEKMNVVLDFKNESILSKDKEIDQLKKQMQQKLDSKNEDLNERNRLIEELKKELDLSNNTISAKDKEIGSLREQLEQELKQSNNTLNLLKHNERNKLVSQYKKHLPGRLVGQLLQFCFHPFVYLRKRREILEVNHSGLFDDTYYLEQNPDLYFTTVNLLQHYMLYGWKEGRNPNPLFDAKYYLENNPDVKEAGINPLLHYVFHGEKEGRNPSNLFDPKYYLETNPDVRNAGIKPLFHYLKNGKKEKRILIPPSLKESKKNNNINNHKDFTFCHSIEKEVKTDFFDCSYYCENYPDVVNAGVDPLYHYLNHGIYEERNPNKFFNAQFFIATHLGNNENNIRSLDAFFQNKKLSTINKEFENLRLYSNMQEIINNGKSLVSIIMPTWNRKDIISRAIESVIIQSYPKWELIIVDDGSSDGTIEFIEKKYQDLLSEKKIRILKSNHLGVSAARNIGLLNAKGNWIAYLDSDNEWHCNYLIYNFYFASLHNNVRILYSDLNFFREGKLLQKVNRLFNFDRLIHSNFIDLNTYFHKKDVYEELGGFDETLDRLVDWDMIIRHTKVYKPLYIPIPLTNYYIGETLNNITTKKPFEKNRNIIMNKNLINWEYCKSKPLKKDFFSIIIPVYNCAELTDKCIDSIIKNTVEKYEIIIIDNASNDHTSNVVEKYQALYSSIKYVKNTNNFGFSVGNNIGTSHASGEYVLFINNDTEVTPGWLSHLKDTLENDSFIGMVAPKLLYPDNTIQFSGFAFSDNSKIPYHLYRNFDSNDVCVNKKRECQALTGACLLMRTTDFLSVKGFDPQFVNGGEDLDLSFKIKNILGKRLMINPLSAVYHLEGKTDGRSKMIMENRKLFVDKWFNEIHTDDNEFYDNDGFIVEKYEKRGSEEHGVYAAYYPVLKVKESKENHTEKQNIGFITMWYQRGITYHTLQLIKSLDENKYTPYVLSRWESDRFRNTGDVHIKNCINAGQNPSTDEIVKWVNENKIKVLVQMEVHPNDWKRLEAIKNETDCKIVIYENLDIMYKENIQKYNIADYFIVNTFYCFNYWCKQFPEIPMYIVPWGIEQKPEYIRTNCSDEIVFLHIAGWGGLNNRKNTGLVIKSFDKAKTNARLRIYIQCSVESLGNDAITIIEKNDRIDVFEGTVNNIYKAYREADVLLWPSKREGLGLPIVEALVHGLPVITSNGYMMKEWIIEGKHGLIVDSNDIFDQRVLPEQDVSEKDLIAKIEMIANDRELFQSLRNNVIKDSRIWKWDNWQKDLFNDAIKKCIENSKESNIQQIPAWRIL